MIYLFIYFKNDHLWSSFEDMKLIYNWHMNWLFHFYAFYFDINVEFNTATK